MAPVILHLYDLSGGMARSMSLAMIGKQLDGIWHSGIAVFGIEYFYGGGICAAPAGRAIPQLSFQEIPLGETSKTQIELENFLQSINHRFTQATYSLLRHNCNNFANEVAMFLTGKGIPEHIIKLPQEFLSSPMGMTLAPMIEGMEQRMRNELVGNGRGLNPFGHIQGRVHMFPPSPAVADSHVPALQNDGNQKPSSPVSNRGQQAVQGRASRDVSLLKIALDGIPTAIMNSELRVKIAELRADVVDELVALMKSQLKSKNAVLLTFNTIVSYYWDIAEFRAAIDAIGSEFLSDLFQFSLNSDNGHVIGAALNSTISISGSPSKVSNSVLAECILPLVIRTIADPKTRNKAILLCLNYLQNADPVNDSKEVYVQIFERVTNLIAETTDLNENAIATQALHALEITAAKFIRNAIDPFALSILDVSLVIGIAEKSRDQVQMRMPHLLRLVLER